MDKREFATFAAALRTYFPRYNMLPNDEAMTLWYTALQDLPYPVLSTALTKWVATEKWPPSIAELRTACTEIVSGKLPDWGEAWAEVSQAIRRFGWCRPSEALASMSPTARRAADMIGWQQICESENPEAIRAQFRQVYEICQRREAEDRQLPAALKETIAQIGSGELLKLEANL